MYNQKPLSGDLIDYGHPLSNGLVGCWLFNEGSGNKVFDLSGNNGIGTFVGTPDWVNGEFGYAINIGAAERITIPKVSSVFDFGTSPYTILAWIKVVAGTATCGIVGFDTYNPGFAMTATERLYLWDGSSKGTSSVMAAGWRQVAFVRESTAAGGTHYYIDTILDTSVTHSDSVAVSTGISIGDHDYSGTYPFLSNISHVMIYNRALSAFEIAFVYREPFCMVRTKRRRIITEAPAAAAVTKIGASYVCQGSWGVRVCAA